MQKKRILRPLSCPFCCSPSFIKALSKIEYKLLIISFRTFKGSCEYRLFLFILLAPQLSSFIIPVSSLCCSCCAADVSSGQEVLVQFVWEQHGAVCCWQPVDDWWWRSIYSASWPEQSSRHSRHAQPHAASQHVSMTIQTANCCFVRDSDVFVTVLEMFMNLSCCHTVVSTTEKKWYVLQWNHWY